jgi:hypothetical protein
MVLPYPTGGSRAISSAGERFVHTEEVTGSIPVSPTSARATCVRGKRGPGRPRRVCSASPRVAGGFAHPYPPGLWLRRAVGCGERGPGRLRRVCSASPRVAGGFAHPHPPGPWLRRAVGCGRDGCASAGGVSVRPPRMWLLRAGGCGPGGRFFVRPRVGGGLGGALGRRFATQGVRLVALPARSRVTAAGRRARACSAYPFVGSWAKPPVGPVARRRRQSPCAEKEVRPC